MNPLISSKDRLTARLIHKERDNIHWEENFTIHENCLLH